MSRLLTTEHKWGSKIEWYVDDTGKVLVKTTDSQGTTKIDDKWSPRFIDVLQEKGPPSEFNAPYKVREYILDNFGTAKDRRMTYFYHGYYPKYLSNAMDNYNAKFYPAPSQYKPLQNNFEQRDSEITPNFYPHCTNEQIVELISYLVPKVDLIILQPTTFTQYMLKEAENSAVASINFFKSIYKALSNRDNSGFESSDDEDMTKKLDESKHFGFFRGMGIEDAKVISDILVFNSPSIETNLETGYASEQSMFDFAKSLIKNSLVGNLIDAATEAITGSSHGSDFANIGLGALQNTSELAGISPRVGPYFTFKEKPFDNNPSFSFETQLINDTYNDYEQNMDFIRCISKDALMYQKEESVFYPWTPSKLFNIRLKFGVDVYRVFNVCTANINIEPMGLTRQSADGMQNIPDGYKINFNFKSLLPDTQDLWSGFLYEGNPA